MNLFTKKLIERLEQDRDSAKLRMQCFKAGSREHAFNQATMLQASCTLFDVRDIPKYIQDDNKRNL